MNTDFSSGADASRKKVNNETFQKSEIIKGKNVLIIKMNMQKYSISN